MEISFKQATRALGHVKKQEMPNGQQWIPDLLKTKGLGGWAYHLKNDLNTTFAPEIEQMEDLKQEAFKLLPKGTQELRPDKEWVNNLEADEDSKERLIAIVEEMNSLLQEERELTLTKGKIKESKIDQHIVGATFEDLLFAIELETKSEDNGKE